MDVLTLARWEFALTAGCHFLMVATTLGLAPVVATLHTLAARADRPGQPGAPGQPGRRERLVAARDRLLRIYLVNYGVGIITGLVMELQFALNWTGSPNPLYDPIATALGVETLAAFFVESTLLGLFLLTPGVLSEGRRALLLWGVAVTAWLSAVVVISANAFLHRPVGIETVDGGAVLAAPLALLTQPAAVMVWVHILGAAALVAAFWNAAAGAHLLLRDGEAAAPGTGRLLLRTGVWLALAGSVVTIVSGLFQFSVVRAPGTTSYGWHGFLLALMMLVGVLILLFTVLVLLPLLLTGRLHRQRWALRLMTVGVWIPLVTTLLGWVYREEARQPWFVVGHITVAEAVSADDPAALLATGAAFVLLGLGAAVLAWSVMSRELMRPLPAPEVAR